MSKMTRAPKTDSPSKKATKKSKATKVETPSDVYTDVSPEALAVAEVDALIAATIPATAKVVEKPKAKPKPVAKIVGKPKSSLLAPENVITLIKTDNPHREGCKDWADFAKLKTGMTVETATGLGVRGSGYLLYARSKGLLTINPAGKEA